jgi:hypothetical protein
MKMKAYPESNYRKILCLLAVSAMVASAALSAHAADEQRTLTLKPLVGACCFLFGPAVTVNEPSNPTPVVVTFTTDYTSNARFLLGLNVNNRGCTNYGSREAPLATNFTPAAYQWVIFPSDGALLPGVNIISLCGGGVPVSGTFNMGFETLTAHRD